MKLEDYFNQFPNHKELVLIGPLFNGGPFVFSEPLVYVDGGRDRWHQDGFCVGDGDSVLRQEVIDDILDTEKDFSDLEYVLRHIPSGLSKIRAFGFLGGRKDHELSNLGSFFKLAKRQKVEVTLSEKMSLFSPGAYKFDFKGGFSILPYEKGFLKIQGDCKYLFEGVVDSAFSSQFISNKALGAFRLQAMTPFSLYRY